MTLSAPQAKYFAHWLTRSLPSDNLGKLTASLQDAQVDLTPHQIDAALFAFKSPLSKGAILADEVGLGKTIEAGIILSQFWAEHRRHLLIIAPANLRKQWAAELQDKFYLPSRILESKTFNGYIEQGNLNPFNCEEIVICSYQFAKTKAPYLKQTNWDLVVIDEAHRLRNVYKPNNKISNVIKNALADSKKILLTATPLQNSILELYGLTSIIDDYVFGDLKSFKMQYNRNLDENDFQNLRRRLAPLCKRTLRRQVLEYVRYTKRIAILQEFFPTKMEQELYDLVSEYLQRPHLYALPNSQRQLMTLILRKLLASSTHAIYGTLCSLIAKLDEKLKRQGIESDESLFSNDYEDYESETDEWLDDEEDEEEPVEEEILSPHDIECIKKEIADLEKFRDLAFKIKRNSKAEQLFEGLNQGFAQLEELGAPKKALIFTESRRTQDFLFELLEKRGYKGKVVLFNGSNSDKQSPAIYKAWKEKHKGTSKITGSATADKRSALVDYFRDEATIIGKGDNVPRIKRFLSEVKDGVVAMTLWPHTEVGHNQDAKKEIKALNFESVFDTPKPEKLIERILTLGSNPGDIVLDSFLGSGTSTAVAHKMGRRWIGVELGNHAYTHSTVRMKKVIEGEQGGISKSVNWQGGGGFKFYELAPSLLNKDKYGNLVINKEYNADMLAAAMAKHQGFTYSPDEEVYWKQGKSSEHDFIFTTTKLLTAEML